MDASAPPLLRLWVPLAACVAAVAAVSVAAPSDNFVDRALPLYALALATVAVLEGRRFGDAPLALALPALAAVRVAVYDENLRLLVYGILLAAAVTIFAARSLARHGRLTMAEGIALTVACVAAAKLVPFSRELAPAQAVVIAGSAILVVSLAGRRGVDAGAILVAVAAGLVAPLDPLKASLFPILLAATLFALRGPSLFSLGALAGSAALAGRWSWPIAALVVLVLLLEEAVESVRARRRVAAPAAAAAAPFGPGAWSTGALAAAAFSPESLAELPRLAFRARAGAAALAAAALVLRPALGTLYAVGAIAILLTSGGDERAEGAETRTLPLTATVFAASMLALVGYSGAVASRFPLPLSIAGVALVALVALAAWPARRVPALALALSVALLVAGAAVAHRGMRADASRGLAVLSPGETYEAQVTASDSVRIELAGGNLAGLEPGTVVATVVAADADGRAERREVRIGEIADWGFGRPGHYFAARNEWPVATGARVGEYGHEAFFGGSGTIEVELPRLVVVRVSASPALPASGRINVDAVTVAGR